MNNIHQPSLWDNLALENGYRYLFALKFDEAIAQFEEALQSPTGEQETIHIAIATCKYWQDKMTFPPPLPASRNNSENRHQYIAGFLEDYIKYPFAPRMMGFKKALCGYVVELIRSETEPDLNYMESIFDLLLELEEHQKSGNLISHYVKQYPEKHFLCYYLAQAQWLNGNKTEAYSNYARALIYSPDKAFTSRIENDKLKKLIHSHGAAMAVAYGRLYDILPFIRIPEEIQSLDKKHHLALKSYLLLQKAQMALHNNDRKSCIHYRKQLKEEAPALYNAYFNLLKQRK